MPYIGFGLVTIIVGLLLFLGSDSPGTLARSETFGLLLLVGGVVAVLDRHSDPRQFRSIAPTGVARDPLRPGPPRECDSARCHARTCRRQ